MFIEDLIGLGGPRSAISKIKRESRARASHDARAVSVEMSSLRFSFSGI